jgi:hypothetical protein
LGHGGGEQRSEHGRFAGDPACHQGGPRERYRGAIKTVLSDNVFDENVVLRHTGDFGANAEDLVFEWWYRPDDGSLNVMPPYIVDRNSAGPWLLFPT